MIQTVKATATVKPGSFIEVHSDELPEGAIKIIEDDSLTTWFEYLQFCLKQVVADNETDNIKTYGESLAQMMWFVGVKPVPDALGRMNKLELISLEELGRPRIDVVINCSGVFRDLFVNQMALLDRAVKMAAEADEPLEMNYVRKHAMAQAEEFGITLRSAATRIFSNASGFYAADVNLAVENSSWEGEQELRDMYLARKSFSFNCDNLGVMDESRGLLEASLKTADVTFQNLDSSEISLTDVSHYFDSDPTKVVASLREDGKKLASLRANGSDSPQYRFGSKD